MALDEPASAIDVVSQAQILKILDYVTPGRIIVGRGNKINQAWK